MSECHFGVELPADGSECPVCKQGERGQCGFAWYGGFRAGYDQAIAILATCGNEFSGDDLRYMAIWLNEGRPPEAQKPQKVAGLWKLPFFNG